MKATAQVGVTSFGSFRLTGTTTLTENRWYQMTVSSRASSHVLAVDGVQDASSTDSRTSDFGGVWQVAGDNNPFSSNAPQIDVSGFATWARAFNAAEIAQLAADPFCFLRW